MITSQNHILTGLKVTVNGIEYSRRIPAHIRLLDFLRNELRLTGTKEVCGEGECGACSVILDGKLVNSCLILAVETNGAEIVTIEGFSDGKSLTDLQQAFIDNHSVQCGYCIPGMIVSGGQFLKESENPARPEIAEGLSGNLCRCTGYHKIIDAIEKVGQPDKVEKPGSNDR